MRAFYMEPARPPNQGHGCRGQQDVKVFLLLFFQKKKTLLFLKKKKQKDFCFLRLYEVIASAVRFAPGGCGQEAAPEIAYAVICRMSFDSVGIL
jgi:hypothetical protein